MQSCSILPSLCLALNGFQFLNHSSLQSKLYFSSNTCIGKLTPALIFSVLLSSLNKCAFKKISLNYTNIYLLLLKWKQHTLSWVRVYIFIINRGKHWSILVFRIYWFCMWKPQITWVYLPKDYLINQRCYQKSSRVIDEVEMIKGLAITKSAFLQRLSFESVIQSLGKLNSCVPL